MIEQRESGYVSNVPRSAITGGPSLIPGQVSTFGETFTADRSYSAVLPRFNALFRLTPDINLYGTVSKGRRSPVVQLTARRLADGSAAPNLQLVPEETVWNYEGGVKGQTGIFGGSVGVFYQQYDGFQVSVIQPDGTSRTESAGSASNLGVEAEFTLDPTPWLGLFANGAYIDAKIDEDDAFSPAFSGARFRLQPKYQASGRLYRGCATWNWGARYSPHHPSPIAAVFSSNCRTAISLISQDDVFLVNARAGVSFAEDRFEAGRLYPQRF